MKLKKTETQNKRWLLAAGLVSLLSYGEVAFATPEGEHSVTFHNDTKQKITLSNPEDLAKRLGVGVKEHTSMCMVEWKLPKTPVVIEAGRDYTVNITDKNDFGGGCNNDRKENVWEIMDSNNNFINVSWSHYSQNRVWVTSMAVCENSDLKDKINRNGSDSSTSFPCGASANEFRDRVLSKGGWLYRGQPYYPYVTDNSNPSTITVNLSAIFPPPPPPPPPPPIQIHYYDPREVIKAMATPDKNFNPVVLAHRGLWQKRNRETIDPLAPENSYSALKLADENGIEAVELDAKSTCELNQRDSHCASTAASTNRPGTPVVMHDFNLGGTTNIAIMNRSGVVEFNPYLNNSNEYNNPTVASVDNDTFKKLQLRKSRTSAIIKTAGGISSEPAISVEQIYRNYYEDKLSTVIVWDIKTDKDAIGIAKVLENLGLDYSHGTIKGGLSARDITIFKVNATIYPKGDYLQQMRDAGIENPPKAMPIYTTNMETVIDKSDKISLVTSLASWKVMSKGFFLAPEINLKQHGGLLSEVMNYAGVNNMSVGVFNAIPDWTGFGPTVPDIDKNRTTGTISPDMAFFNNDGRCCYQLSDKFSSYDGTLNGSDDGKKDTADNRGSWNFIKDEDFGMVTTDRPLEFIEYIGSSRNTARYAEAPWRKQ